MSPPPASDSGRRPPCLGTPRSAHLGVHLSLLAPLCRAGGGAILQKRQPRLREGPGSAGLDSYSAQQGRGPAKLLFSCPASLCTSHHNPAVQGAETGNLRCGELIPRDNCPEAAGVASIPTPHPALGRRTATTRPKQIVLGRGIGLGSTTPQHPPSPLSLSADWGGAFESINSSPNKQVFKTNSLWISLPISFFNPDSC